MKWVLLLMTIAPNGQVYVEVLDDNLTGVECVQEFERVAGEFPEYATYDSKHWMSCEKDYNQ